MNLLLRLFVLFFVFWCGISLAEIPPHTTSWLSQVADQIKQQERAPRLLPMLGSRALDEPQWHMVNREHELRAYFTKKGWILQDRQDADAWRWRFQVERVNRWSVAADPVITPVNAGVEKHYGKVMVERFINQDEGIEQFFELAKPLDDSPRLEIAGVIETDLELLLDERARLAFGREGETLLTYSKPLAWDARGTELPIHFRTGVKKGQSVAFALIVDTTGAQYPITIDPIAATPSWEEVGEQSGSRFGITVDTLGDVNGDGFSDIGVVAEDFDDGAELQTGRSYAFYGSANGPSTSPDWTTTGTSASARMKQIAPAGDVNGDGYSDVIVSEDTIVGSGTVYAFYGSPTGLSIAADWTETIGNSMGNFGQHIDAAGDVNGDGYGDIIIADPNFRDTEFGQGRVYVYLGSATGLEATAAWTYTATQQFGNYGEVVAGVGDVNGDGFSDIMAGSRFISTGMVNGIADLFYGSASGPSLSPDISYIGEAAVGAFGATLDGAGDVNGDGYDDIIISAFQFANTHTSQGKLYVYHGSATGPSLTPDFTTEGGGSFYSIGETLSPAGDLNGDGYDDVLTASGAFDPTPAIAFFGGPSGLSSTPGWTSTLDGRYIAGAGDVNGDGYADILRGDEQYDFNGNDRGRALLYYGGPDLPSTSADWMTEGNQLNSRYGYAVAHAGDVNADGFADIVVGASEFDGGEPNEGRAFLFLGSSTGPSVTADWTSESDTVGAQFGFDVASAGDVNRDGFSDVAVSARYYTDGETEEGRVYVFHGNAMGLSSTPSWTTESNQAGANLGWSLSGAGDVNGDGYSDLVVGAPFFDAGDGSVGRVSVYHGSASGLELTPAWTSDGTQEDARYGFSVAGAGDVNRDGFSDILIGQSLYENGNTGEGRALLYLGGVTGVSSTPAWQFEGDQEHQ